MTSNCKNESNFEFVAAEPKFHSFASVAVAAEKILDIDPAACVLNCRRALEFAIKWMYAADADLELPPEDNLNALINNRTFKEIVDRDLRKRMDVIRRLGNTAAHEEESITRDEALVCLEYLHVFLDYLDYCYGDVYEGQPFHTPESPQQREENQGEEARLLRRLMRENNTLRIELAAHRAEQQMNYIPKPLDDSEQTTREVYLETMLKEAGWIFGKNLSYDVLLPGMPQETDPIDYLLQDDEGKVLAVLELTHTCRDVEEGRTQAMRYAVRLEELQGYRPVMILSNGFDLLMQEPWQQERSVAGIYSPTDLMLQYRLNPLNNGKTIWKIDQNVTGRYYRKEAAEAVCRSFSEEGRRKAIITMAPGAGKTRTVIGVCKAMLEQNAIRNVLFLTDKESLMIEANTHFRKYLPEAETVLLKQGTTGLPSNGHRPRVVIATYDGMADAIDEIKNPESCPVDGECGRLFTVGYFDLVICDEVHESVYYRNLDILNYFDARLIGLTAVPKEELARETYEIYDLEAGHPTYEYSLKQAMTDGYPIKDGCMVKEELL